MYIYIYIYTHIHVCICICICIYIYISGNCQHVTELNHGRFGARHSTSRKSRQAKLEGHVRDKQSRSFSWHMPKIVCIARSTASMRHGIQDTAHGPARGHETTSRQSTDRKQTALNANQPPRHGRQNTHARQSQHGTQEQRAREITAYRPDDHGNHGITGQADSINESARFLSGPANLKRHVPAGNMAAAL